MLDTYSSYALGFLHFNKGAEGAVGVLDNDALPFYEKHSIEVEKILTDNGTVFKGNQTHPYQIYLELNAIKDPTTQERSPQRNGFIEGFKRSVLDEFFRIKFREKRYEKVEVLQKDLDKCLAFYNKPSSRLAKYGTKTYWNYS